MSIVLCSTTQWWINPKKSDYIGDTRDGKTPKKGVRGIVIEGSLHTKNLRKIRCQIMQMPKGSHKMKEDWGGRREIEIDVKIEPDRNKDSGRPQWEGNQLIEKGSKRVFRISSFCFERSTCTNIAQSFTLLLVCDIRKVWAHWHKMPIPKLHCWSCTFN